MMGSEFGPVAGVAAQTGPAPTDSPSAPPTLAGAMQGMLDVMGDLLAGPARDSLVVGNAWQDMSQTAEHILSGSASGTVPATELMQTMLDTMRTVSSGGIVTSHMQAAEASMMAPSGTAISGAALLPHMMLSSDGHVLAATIDRDHLTVSPTGGGFVISELGTTGQGISMMAGVDSVIAPDGQIMMGLNDAIAGPVWRLYEATLGRQPDAPGFQYWMSVLENGTSVQDVARSFMATPDFQAKYGHLNDAQFIDQLYHDVLHRNADTPGMDYWTDQMRHGITHETALAAFANSPENMALTAAHAGTSGYWLL